jgi:hypothetical protein
MSVKEAKRKETQQRNSILFFEPNPSTAIPSRRHGIALLRKASTPVFMHLFVFFLPVRFAYSSRFSFRFQFMSAPMQMFLYNYKGLSEIPITHAIANFMPRERKNEDKG